MMFRNYRHEIVVAGLLVALMCIVGSLLPNLLAVKGQLILSKYLWATAILSIGMTMIIVSGGIDLSVGSTMGLCAVSFGIAHSATGSVAIGCMASLLVGFLSGSVNGWLISKLDVHPLIITLATYAGYRGVAEGLSQGKSYEGFGAAFGQFSRGTLLGVPFPAWIFVCLAIVAAVFLRRTPTGRFVYAIGHNETAARFSGVQVKGIKFWLYVVSGSLAGLATLFDISNFGTAKADSGQALELDVITAVVVGGTSIFGGRGTIIGTALGLLLIHETKLFVGQYWGIEELKSVVIGLLLIVAMLSQRVFFRSPSE